MNAQETLGGSLPGFPELGQQTPACRQRSSRAEEELDSRRRRCSAEELGWEWDAQAEALGRRGKSSSVAAASGPSLREIIRGISEEAAAALQEAGITEDADIRLLTREDLSELLPGIKNFKERKRIGELITNSRHGGTQARDLLPKGKDVNIETVIKNLEAFIPSDVFSAALSPGGALSDYLPLLKELRHQLVGVQFFLQQHIDLLERHTCGETTTAPSLAAVAGPSGPGPSDQPSSPSTHPDPPDQISTLAEASSGFKIRFPFWNSRDGGAGSEGPKKQLRNEKNEKKEKKEALGAASRPAEVEDDRYEAANKRTSSVPKKPKRPAVRVHFLVCGKTLDQHITLMGQVAEAGVELHQTSQQDCHVIVVFCTISSRVGTDVGAAKSKTPGGKDVILVMMHHTFDQDYVTNQRAGVEWHEVKQEVNVLFHDSQGLLRCQSNTNAVQRIYDTLLKYAHQ